MAAGDRLRDLRQALGGRQWPPLRLDPGRGRRRRPQPVQRGDPDHALARSSRRIPPRADGQAGPPGRRRPVRGPRLGLTRFAAAGLDAVATIPAPPGRRRGGAGPVAREGDPVLDRRPMRRGVAALVTLSLLVAGAVLGAGPVQAVAVTYNVNTTADEIDVDVANPFCTTASGKCSLRAAIMQANYIDPGSGNQHTINVPSGTYTLSIGSGGENDAEEGDI